MFRRYRTDLGIVLVNFSIFIKSILCSLPTQICSSFLVHFIQSLPQCLTHDSRHQLTLRDYVTHDAFSSAQTTSLRDNLLIEGHLIHRWFCLSARFCTEYYRFQDVGTDTTRLKGTSEERRSSLIKQITQMNVGCFMVLVFPQIIFV